MSDATKKGAFLIAMIFTWVCFSAVIFNFAKNSGVTGAAVGVNVAESGSLDEYQYVLIKPRGAYASKILRTMDSVKVKEMFWDSSFTASIESVSLPKIKTMGDVYYLRES